MQQFNSDLRRRNHRPSRKFSGLKVTCLRYGDLIMTKVPLDFLGRGFHRLERTFQNVRESCSSEKQGPRNIVGLIVGARFCKDDAYLCCLLRKRKRYSTSAAVNYAVNLVHYEASVFSAWSGFRNLPQAQEGQQKRLRHL